MLPSYFSFPLVHRPSSSRDSTTASFIQHADLNMASMLFSGNGARSISPADKDHAAAVVHPLMAQNIDTAAITAKYDEERAKRDFSSGVSQFKHPQGPTSGLKKDVFKSQAARDPVTAETSVLIVGGGFAGLVTAVKLKKDHGIDDFLVVDKAGGFGGTWYWNQYPGTIVFAFEIVLGHWQCT